MSESIVFIVGCIVFAITVYGTVMAGGTVLTRRQIARDPAVRDEPMVAGRLMPASDAGHPTWDRTRATVSSNRSQ